MKFDFLWFYIFKSLFHQQNSKHLINLFNILILLNNRLFFLKNPLNLFKQLTQSLLKALRENRIKFLLFKPYLQGSFNLHLHKLRVKEGESEGWDLIYFLIFFNGCDFLLISRNAIYYF
jgi:hypothetical protein